jgi:hypothetical protein
VTKGKGPEWPTLPLTKYFLLSTEATAEGLDAFLLQFQRCQPGGLDIADQHEGDLSIGAHADSTAELRLPPNAHVQHITGADLIRVRIDRRSDLRDRQGFGFLRLLRLCRRALGLRGRGLRAHGPGKQSDRQHTTRKPPSIPNHTLHRDSSARGGRR